MLFKCFGYIFFYFYIQNIFTKYEILFIIFSRLKRMQISSYKNHFCFSFSWSQRNKDIQLYFISDILSLSSFFLFVCLSLSLFSHSLSITSFCSSSPLPNTINAQVLLMSSIFSFTCSTYWPTLIIFSISGLSSP